MLAPLPAHTDVHIHVSRFCAARAFDDDLGHSKEELKVAEDASPSCGWQHLNLREMKATGAAQPRPPQGLCVLQGALLGRVVRS